MRPQARLPLVNLGVAETRRRIKTAGFAADGGLGASTRLLSHLDGWQMIVTVHYGWRRRLTQCNVTGVPTDLRASSGWITRCTPQSRQQPQLLRSEAAATLSE
jgi:hypothetical protein